MTSQPTALPWLFTHDGGPFSLCAASAPALRVSLITRAGVSTRNTVSARVPLRPPSLPVCRVRCDNQGGSSAKCQQLDGLGIGLGIGIEFRRREAQASGAQIDEDRFRFEQRVRHEHAFDGYAGKQ